MLDILIIAPHPDDAELGMGGAMPALEAPALDGRLEAARRLAKENPVAMASLVRGWVNKD